MQPHRDHNAKLSTTVWRKVYSEQFFLDIIHSNAHRPHSLKVTKNTSGRFWQLSDFYKPVVPTEQNQQRHCN